MSIFHRNAVHWLVILSCGFASAILQSSTARAEQPCPDNHIWLDIDGEPLPFQDHTTILHVIRNAALVSREIGGTGEPGMEKLVLDQRNVRFCAVFRTIDESVRVPPSGDSRRSSMRYRDAAVFESAAYELSELLGIGRVPPTTERRIGDQYGTVQICVGGAHAEAHLAQRGKLNPPDRVRWNQQKQIMLVFDNLIANTGRNPGNLLVDSSWNVWFIDHTHAFRQMSRLLYAEHQAACERRLWTSLREVGEDAIRRTLEPYLEDREIRELLRRRLKLIHHIEKLIDKHGEDAVIFDLQPPATETTDEVH